MNPRPPPSSERRAFSQDFFSDFQMQLKASRPRSSLLGHVMPLIIRTAGTLFSSSPTKTDGQALVSPGEGVSPAPAQQHFRFRSRAPVCPLLWVHH
jgi:hypothetical protein